MPLLKVYKPLNEYVFCFWKRNFMVDAKPSFLEQVKRDFSDHPKVYSNFIDIMKTYKLNT